MLIFTGALLSLSLYIIDNFELITNQTGGCELRSELVQGGRGKEKAVMREIKRKLTSEKFKKKYILK